MSVVVWDIDKPEDARRCTVYATVPVDPSDEPTLYIVTSGGTGCIHLARAHAIAIANEIMFWAKLSEGGR